LRGKGSSKLFDGEGDGSADGKVPAEFLGQIAGSFAGGSPGVRIGQLHISGRIHNPSDGERPSTPIARAAHKENITGLDRVIVQRRYELRRRLAASQAE
jgi:hypothetical protein